MTGINYNDLNALLYRSGALAVIAAVEASDNGMRKALIDSFEKNLVANVRRVEAMPNAEQSAPPTEGIVRIVQENLKLGHYVARAKGKAADPLLQTYITRAARSMSSHGIEPAELPAGVIASMNRHKLKRLAARTNPKPGI